MEELPPPPLVHEHPKLSRHNAYDGYDSKRTILNNICNKSIITVFINCVFLWCLYLIGFNLILSIIFIIYMNLYSMWWKHYYN